MDEKEKSYGVTNEKLDIELAKASKNTQEPTDKEVTKARKQAIKKDHKEVSLGKKETKSPGLLQEIEELKKKGKTKDPVFKEKMKQLEVLLGVDQVNPFGTNELDILVDQLNGMTVADMQSLARRVGINPLYNRTTLKHMLIKEFKATNKNNMRNVLPGPAETVKLDPNNPLHQEAKKILGEF